MGIVTPFCAPICCIAEEDMYWCEGAIGMQAIAAADQIR
jgi:hypothetical protein